MIMAANGIRLDHQVIFRVIEPGARVLDLGCGNGDLLYLLARDKKAKVQGIELNDSAIHECVKKGLSVFHSDIETGLREYPDRSFDYVILNQSMQEVKNVDWVIGEALRIGSKIVVGFPNFAFREARLMLFFKGRAPLTPSLPYHWYDTPNVRFLSLKDFEDFCRKKNLKVLEAHYLGDQKIIKVWPNLRALNAVFVLTR
ncbi:MAG: methionine biosynthesis protein MetW [Deltaproteobacteria bacterium]|nr:methionine biosynthesis protein MetW [Deltaproteobacteria bacterium]